MKNILTSILLLLSIVSATYASPQLVAQADSAYAAADYGRAIELYDSVIAEAPTAALYYNLGNARYRSGELGGAVLAYERALRINPAYADAAKNLQFVRTKLVDRPGERGTLAGNAFDAAALIMHSDLWAWLAFGLFVLGAAGIVLYVRSASVGLRKLGFFGAGGAFAVCVVALILSIHARSLALDDTMAVVMSKNVILSTVPRQPSGAAEEALMLHEGALVEVLDSVNSGTADSTEVWLDVQVDNLHRAWIPAADVERIMLPKGH